MFDLDDFFTREEELLGADDEAELECSDCLGCTNCCRELSAAITLDAWDVALLKEGLHLSFDEMVEKGYISFTEQGKALLPIFGNKPDRSECIFLGEDGRCSIHPYRAGICRMYPLARLWRADGRFSYYLQRGECEHRKREKKLISEWLGYPDTAAYEQTISAYHLRLNAYREQCVCARTDEELSRIRQQFISDNFR